MKEAFSRVQTERRYPKHLRSSGRWGVVYSGQQADEALKIALIGRIIRRSPIESGRVVSSQQQAMKTLEEKSI